MTEKSLKWLGFSFLALLIVLISGFYGMLTYTRNSMPSDLKLCFSEETFIPTRVEIELNDFFRTHKAGAALDQNDYVFFRNIPNGRYTITKFYKEFRGTSFEQKIEIPHGATYTSLDCKD